MTHAKKRAQLALLATAVGTLGALGATTRAADSAAQPSAQDLKRQIQALQEKVDAMEARQQAHNARDVDATVQRVLSDANQRSQFLASDTPFLAGWKGGKFIIQSEDGNFSISPGIQFQFRYVNSWRDDGKNSGHSDTQSGFEFRRARIGFAGNVFTKDLTYSILLTNNRDTGAVSLDEWWARYKFAPEWSVRAGQFKDPVSHEQMSSSKTFLAVDESLLSSTFLPGKDKVQGINLLYGSSKNPLAGSVAFTDGASSLNTDFRDDPSAPGVAQTRPDYGLAGRVEYKLFGDWKNYSDFTALGMKNNLFVIGGGTSYSEVSSQQRVIYTADASYKMTNGLALYGALIGRYTHDGGAGDDANDWGGLAQAAYLLDGKRWEVFGRYDYLDLDSASVSPGAERNIHELTGGVNYYFRGHAAKFTLDATYLPNGAPANQTGLGILATSKDEVVLRAQFQLLL
jgi:hypothetical protein